MATANKFNVFMTDVANGVHDGCLTADTDVLRLYLSNTAPSASLDAVKADLAEISTGFGYSGAIDVQNVKSASGTTITVDGTDILITASGGSIGPFRYLVLYNDTATGDPLIQWWDHGSAVTLTTTQTFNIVFSASGLFRIGG